MKLSDKQWLIEQHAFVTSPHMETCFTLANGYMGVRGTFEEMYPDEVLGTYVAGIYNKSEAQVSEFVNLPYFFGVNVYADQVKVDLTKGKILSYYRTLDMKQGLLYKKLRVEDPSGKVTALEGYRFVSYADRHLAGVRLVVTPENYSGVITVESVTEGAVTNSCYLPRESVKHFTVTANGPLVSQGIYLEVSTRDKDYRVGVASSLHVTVDGTNAAFSRRTRAFGDTAVESVDIDARQGQSYEIEKYIAVYTSRDVAKSQVRAEAERGMSQLAAKRLEAELSESAGILQHSWDVTDIRIEGDEDAEKAIRFNLYHLMNCANPDDERISIGAKGIHGEGYKGHIFWDTEIFMLPFFTYAQPRSARSLLMYRYHLLDAARENAKLNGFRGAQYPWESADTGLEETPRWGYDYKGNPVRIWTGDIEHHITADVAYAIWQYYRATGDKEFFYNYGLEMFLETARFWSSRGEYNAKLDRYEINQVIGPDEFHEHVDNNVYTNYFAKWNLEKGLQLLQWLGDQEKNVYNRLMSKLAITEAELRQWKEVADKIYIPIDPNKPLMEQFEGYFKLEDVLITEYDDNNMPVWPEGVDITNLNKYTLIKQADVIMLLHLIGEDFEHATKKLNFEYYEQRTMHKSSLSPSIYSLMGLVVGDHSKAYEYLMRTAKVDLEDNQGNAGLGFHSASAGGTWQAAIFGFGGMNVKHDGTLGFSPTWLPDSWQRYAFCIHWQGRLLEIAITQEELTVEMLEGTEDINIALYDDVLQLKSASKISVPVHFNVFAG